MGKSKQKVEQDYARNAIHDYETGHKKAATYEKKKELETAAGESHGHDASPSKVHRHSKNNRNMLLEFSPMSGHEDDFK